MKSQTRVVASGFILVAFLIASGLLVLNPLGTSSQEPPPAVLSVLDAGDLHRNGITLIEDENASAQVARDAAASMASRNNGAAEVGEIRLVRLTVRNTSPIIDGRLVWAIEIDEPAVIPSAATHEGEPPPIAPAKTFWVEFYDAQTGEFVFAYSGGAD